MEEEDEKDHLDYRKTPLALLKKKRNSSQVNMSEAALELGSGGTYFKSKRSDNMVSTYGGEGDEVTSLTSTQTSKKHCYLHLKTKDAILRVSPLLKFVCGQPSVRKKDMREA